MPGLHCADIINGPLQAFVGKMHSKGCWINMAHVHNQMDRIFVQLHRYYGEQQGGLCQYNFDNHPSAGA
jgi:hypothetical protein